MVMIEESDGKTNLIYLVQVISEHLPAPKRKNQILRAF